MTRTMNTPSTGSLLYRSRRYERLSALLVAIFVFLFGLVLPVSFAIPASISVSIITIGLVAYALVTGRIRFSLRTFWLIAIPLLMLLLKMPFEYVVSTDEGNVAKRMMIGFLTAGISGILMGTIRFRADDFFEIGYKVAWVNFVLVAFTPLTPMYRLGEESVVNYMRYGYAMLPTVLLSYSMLQRGKGSFGSRSLCIVSLILMFIFGARGAFVTFILFATILFLFQNKEAVWKKVLTISFIGITLANLPVLLKKIVQILDSLHLSSYSISKYSEVLLGESIQESSSGRDILYKKAIDRILELKPFGDPINSCYMDTLNFSYYHNIVLDLFVNYGIFISTALLCIALALVWNVMRRCSDHEVILVFLTFMVIPLGRLLLSSSFWLRADFWFFVSYAASLSSQLRRTRAQKTSCNNNGDRALI